MSAMNYVPLSLQELPREVLSFPLSSALDPASATMLAFANKTFYSLLKDRIIGISDFSMAVARDGSLNLLSLAIDSASSRIARQAPVEAIVHGHHDCLSLLIKHFPDLLRKKKESEDSHSYLPLSLRMAQFYLDEPLVAVGRTGDLSLYDKLIALGFKDDQITSKFSYLSVGAAYADKVDCLREIYDMKKLKFDNYSDSVAEMAALNGSLKCLDFIYEKRGIQSTISTLESLAEIVGWTGRENLLDWFLVKFREQQAIVFSGAYSGALIAKNLQFATCLLDRLLYLNDITSYVPYDHALKKAAEFGMLSALVRFYASDIHRPKLTRLCDNIIDKAANSCQKEIMIFMDTKVAPIKIDYNHWNAAISAKNFAFMDFLASEPRFLSFVKSEFVIDSALRSRDIAIIEKVIGVFGNNFEPFHLRGALVGGVDFAFLDFLRSKGLSIICDNIPLIPRDLSVADIRRVIDYILNHSDSSLTVSIAKEAVRMGSPNVLEALKSFNCPMDSTLYVLHADWNNHFAIEWLVNNNIPFNTKDFDSSPEGAQYLKSLNYSGFKVTAEGELKITSSSIPMRLRGE